jgi:hypothetical protein
VPFERDWGFINKEFPLMILLKDTCKPFDLTNSIGLFPNLIASLNFRHIILFKFTLNAFFAGSIDFNLGHVLFVVKHDVNGASLFPERSLTQPVCKINTYLTPLERFEVGLIVKVFPLIIFLN